MLDQKLPGPSIEIPTLTKSFPRHQEEVAVRSGECVPVGGRRGKSCCQNMARGQQSYDYGWPTPTY